MLHHRRSIRSFRVEQRTYTGAQRRAVVARDRHCRYPGCIAAPALCEVHHTTWWCRGGHTAVGTGILLCGHHHKVVHQRDIRVRCASGGRRFSERDGRPVGGGGAGRGPGAGPPPEVGASVEPAAMPVRGAHEPLALTG